MTTRPRPHRTRPARRAALVAALLAACGGGAAVPPVADAAPARLQLEVGGARAGRYDVVAAASFCRDTLAGARTLGVQYTDASPLAAISSLQLVVADTGARDTTDALALQLALGPLPRPVDLVLETRPGFTPSGRARAVLRAAGDARAVALTGETAAGVPITLAVHCGGTAAAAAAAEAP